MRYPRKLLPTPYYKIIDSNLKNYYLIRNVEDKDCNELINKETNTLKEEYLYSPSAQGADLSTSLLGIFQIPHIFIELTNIGKEIYASYCQPDIKILDPVFTDHFQINKKRCCWYVKIDDLHEHEIIWIRNEQNYTATCLIKHTPAKWNYWHFSIQWKTDKGMWNELAPEELKKNWVKKGLAHETKAQIAMFATIETPKNYQIIQSKYYHQISLPFYKKMLLYLYINNIVPSSFLR